MKTLKSLAITAVFTYLLISGFATDANAWPRVRVYVGTPRVGVVVAKPGPRYIWVEGHYKINKYGKLVWVPAHWKRV